MSSRILQRASSKTYHREAHERPVPRGITAGCSGMYAHRTRAFGSSRCLTLSATAAAQFKSA